MKIVYLCIALLFSFSLQAQQTKASELLDNAITYHDPQGNWEQFAGEFNIVLEVPNKPDRISAVAIDLPQHYFRLSTEQEGKQSFREIKNNDCRFSEDDGSIATATVSEKACERTLLFKNYYTYLYGLPMKLKDPGTHIDPQVTKKTFKGKEYLVIRVTYEEEVGTDIWQFYFNPDTYAMEVYQFFKNTDETTGEYILLTDEVTIQGIKIPKNRAWYYNKDDEYLATDKLVKD